MYKCFTIVHIEFLRITHQLHIEFLNRDVDFLNN